MSGPYPFSGSGVLNNLIDSLMRRFYLFSLCYCAFFGPSHTPSFSQCQGNSDLKLKEIMSGYEYIGARPGSPTWSLNSKKIYFDWNPEHKPIDDKYEYNLESKKLTKLDPKDYENIPSNSFLRIGKERMIYEKGGDIFLYDLKSGSTSPLLETTDRETLLGLNEDKSAIYFTRSNNVFSMSLDGAGLKQHTNFKKGNKKKEDELSWIEKEERELFEIVQKRDEKSEAYKNLKEYTRGDFPKAWHYASANLGSFAISPNGRYVSFVVYKSNSNPSTEGMNFVSQEGYAKTLKGRAKVGLKRDDQKLAVFDKITDSVYYVNTAQLPGIFDKAEFLKEYHEGKDKYLETYTQPKGVYFHGPKVSDNGQFLFDIKSFDNKDRWIARLDLEKMELVSLDHQHDEAWIGGPGVVSWTSVPGNYGWLDEGNSIYFQSEETGYSHLYSFDLGSSKKKALTKGKFEVHQAELKEDKSGFWIQSNEVDPGVLHFYSMDLGDLKRVQLSKEAGSHNVTVSPDGKKAIDRFSFSNSPWELYQLDLSNQKELSKITSSNSEAFGKYSWRIPELIYFKAEDGEQVRARLYKPEGSKKNNAAVIFVHGAGYLQNVHNWWSSYYREYMFHNMLTDMGYTVLDIDYRGSKGYGRDWRTGIYRHMGGKDLSDQVDGAKWLISEQGIEKERIGIYGGSYGGFISLMALFKNPGVFQGGAALRSVTDWAHYNHPYTSNILNTPEEDPKAFRKSSPIYFAEGLEDRLLMLHGMVDMNVQFQDIVRLSQRLIELEKEDWELAVFPIEGHGFKESSSWHDEYRRIFELFCEELE